MSKAIATFDGFIGWRGSAMHVQAGTQWEVDHPFVQDNPQLFAYPDGNDPRSGTGAAIALQPVEEDDPVVEEAQADPHPELPDEGPQMGDEEEAPPYEEWTVPELQEECEARGLPKTGNKPQLVSRLNKHDEETLVEK